MPTAALTLLLALLAAGDLPVVEPKDDLVITSSCRIKAGTWRIVDEGKPGVLRIEGEDVLVVLDDAVLVGAADGVDPDGFTGTGIVLTGKRNILFGGAVRGFEVAVHVDGAEDCHLIDLDTGGNFAQRLRSTPEREDGSDWLWPHENDEGQWADRYGAGIWVRGGRGVRILGCSGHGSQNGILLDRSEGCVVRDCDYSFNSGWGIALWRSSENEVARNRFDFCVRGYSHGVYARGQDSAGILVFEQCHRNRFVMNSATHGGDGFFLYAGHETTRRTGEGGCNDNVVLRNDFSHAVANGIEATFSTGNRFAGNRLDDCNYGVWAGYSRKSVFEGNVIRGCTYAGVAIEHGSENVIRGNEIEDCPKGVWLWWDEDRDLLDSVYGKKVRTDSADTLVTGNLVTGGKAAFFLRDSARIRLLGNFVRGAGEEVVLEGKCPGLESEPAKEPPEPATKRVPPPRSEYPGRRFIVVHEWGPYDYRAPLLHPARIEGRPIARFRALGASMPLRVEEVAGEVRVGVEAAAGRAPEIVVSPKEGAGSYVPFSFAVEGVAGRLRGSGILLVAKWTVSFWPWEKDPREDAAAFRELLESPPARTITADSLDFPWNTGGPGGGVAPDRFATLATTTLTLPAGTFELETVSDDGARVAVDGEVVIENWTHHGPTVDRGTVELAAGEHEIRVEHFEIDGWARLSFRIRRSR